MTPKVILIKSGELYVDIDIAVVFYVGQLKGQQKKMSEVTILDGWTYKEENLASLL
jgi:hypothetical protein